MTGRPRIEIPQLDIPGVPNTEARFTLHPVTYWNYSQRVTIARRGPQQVKWRFADMFWTRAQLYDLVGELDERAGLMTFEIPERGAT